MAGAARLILDFKRGMSHEAFVGDRRTQSAIVHQMLILGEAAKRLSETFRSDHLDVPWSRIARMRDLMIHHYEAIDIEEVWRTADVDVPDLLSFLEPLLPSRPS